MWQGNVPDRFPRVLLYLDLKAIWIDSPIQCFFLASLVVQWFHASNAGGVGLIPRLVTKIPHAAMWPNKIIIIAISLIRCCFCYLCPRIYQHGLLFGPFQWARQRSLRSPTSAQITEDPSIHCDSVIEMGWPDARKVSFSRLPFLSEALIFFS